MISVQLDQHIMSLTSNNNKKGGKTSYHPTNSVLEKHDHIHHHDPIKQAGDHLIGHKHAKLISSNSNGESQKYLVSKNHFIKGNETRPNTTKTTWIISPPTPLETTPTKNSSVNGKFNFATTGESQNQKSKKVQKSSGKFYEVSLKSPGTGKMEINMNPILITISPDESGGLQGNDLLGEKGTDLTRIMDNFISVTTANFLESGHTEDDSLSSSGKVQIITPSNMDSERCVDFGIADYLCDFKPDEDEIEVDISSDTDSNFIAATPPNRFSDSDFEGIEPISITLETSLNLSQVSQPIIHKIESPQNMDKWGKPEISKLIPRRPFRRHISLPPSLFMSRFFGNNNSKDTSPLLSPINQEFAFFLKPNALGFTKTAGPFHLPRINRLESISSSDMECNSADNSSMKCNYTRSNSSWSMSIESAGEIEFEEQESAFTSDIEKKALLVRSVRRLVRQDTTVGNFAPPDYRNT